MSNKQLAQNLAFQSELEGLEQKYEKELSKLQSIFPEGILVFDLETTGLSPLTHEIIEIGAVSLDFKGLPEVWSSFIRPQKPITDENQAIHGITNLMVDQAFGAKVVLPKFMSFARGKTLWAHNIQFDLGFLAFQSHKNEIEMPSLKAYCSCKLSRSHNRDLGSHKLTSLSEHFNATHVKQHRAADDAWAALIVMLETLKAYEGDIDYKKSYFARTSQYGKKVGIALPGHLRKLPEIIANKQEIEVLYDGGSHRGKMRTLRPISLLPLPAGNVLYAFCKIAKHHKCFALKKIQKMNALEPEDF